MAQPLPVAVEVPGRIFRLETYEGNEWAAFFDDISSLRSRFKRNRRSLQQE